MDLCLDPTLVPQSHPKNMSFLRVPTWPKPNKYLIETTFSIFSWGSIFQLPFDPFRTSFWHPFWTHFRPENAPRPPRAVPEASQGTFETTRGLRLCRICIISSRLRKISSRLCPQMASWWQFNSPKWALRLPKCGPPPAPACQQFNRGAFALHSLSKMFHHILAQSIPGVNPRSSDTSSRSLPMGACFPSGSQRDPE